VVVERYIAVPGTAELQKASAASKSDKYVESQRPGES
jgi:hypothetical protein